jgi:hypothetical protein
MSDAMKLSNDDLRLRVARAIEQNRGVLEKLGNPPRPKYVYATTKPPEDDYGAEFICGYDQLLQILGASDGSHEQDAS